MVYPKIKIKEKRKSFNLKMKIYKSEVEGVIFDSEELTELKRTIMEDLSAEVDNLISNMVENDDDLEGWGGWHRFESALAKVSISVNENDDDNEEEDEEDYDVVDEEGEQEEEIQEDTDEEQK